MRRDVRWKLHLALAAMLLLIGTLYVRSSHKPGERILGFAYIVSAAMLVVGSTITTWKDRRKSEKEE